MPWLRAMIVALLIVLAVPVMALADEGFTAVAEPVATEQPAAEGTATEEPPAEPAPAPAIDPAVETPVATDPPASPEPAPVPVDVPPVLDLPVVAPPIVPVPILTPPTAPPPGGGPNVDPTPLPSLPGAAPELPEIAPVLTSPTPPVSTTPPSVTPVSRIDADTPPPPPAVAPTPSVAASSLGLPGAPALSLGPPPPAFGDAVLAALGDPRAPGAARDAGSQVSAMIGVSGPQIGSADTTGVGASTTEAVLKVADDARAEIVVSSIQAPIGAAPSGSSLLAVLAGYVLPGGGGAPASTIVLLIVLGLILGVTYGAFPQMTERLAAGRLLGASAGHGLAVRRPG